MERASKQGFKRKIDETLPITAETIEALRATHSQCCFFIERKRRFCGVARTPTSLYCGTHLSASQLASSTAPPTRPRIPCPVDPSHTIFADKLEHHVRICNASKELRLLEREPYYCRDCNSGPVSPADAAAATNTAHAVNANDAATTNNNNNKNTNSNNNNSSGSSTIITTSGVDPEALLAKLRACHAALLLDPAFRVAPYVDTSTSTSNGTTGTSTITTSIATSNNNSGGTDSSSREQEKQEEQEGQQAMQEAEEQTKEMTEEESKKEDDEGEEDEEEDEEADAAVMRHVLRSVAGLQSSFRNVRHATQVRAI